LSNPTESCSVPAIRSLPRGQLDNAIRRRDYFRRSPFSIGGPTGHKEWHHFCVLGEHVDLLVNFSLSDDIRPEAPAGAEFARLTVLVRDAGWDGDVDSFIPKDVYVGGGRVDVRFGKNRLRFRDGAYQIAFALEDRPVRGELTLRPQTLPSLAPNIPLPDGPPLHWVIVPRLLASGHVVIDGREHCFTEALTYHDHNWGHFLWGHAFSWVWGFCHPSNLAVPWSLAFVRLSDRLRTCALAQGMFLWGGKRQRVFRERDIEVSMALDCLRPSQVFKIPRVMALLSPETRPDVPRWVEMRADADGDSLQLRFDAEELAQVIIPSETDLSVTIINEVTGRASVRGTILDETVAIDGRGVCEFLST
jgi:hypothetical protein